MSGIMDYQNEAPCGEWYAAISEYDLQFEVPLVLLSHSQNGIL